MTFPILPGVLTATLASVGLANPKELREYEFAEKRLERGEQELVRSVEFRSTAARLNQIDKATRTLRHARNLAADGDGTAFDRLEARATDALVEALGDAAEVHLGRNSLNLAAKRVNEALALDPSDGRAQALKILVMGATVSDDRDATTLRVRRAEARRLGLADPPRARRFLPSSPAETPPSSRLLGGRSGGVQPGPVGTSGGFGQVNPTRGAGGVRSGPVGTSGGFGQTNPNRGSGGLRPGPAGGAGGFGR